MPASNETALRSFFARFLGWADEHKDDVERAVRSAELAATHRAALVLLAETDFVPIALALHRVTRGASAPFVVCDPLRRDTPASARLSGNHANGVAALAAPAGGSLCLRSWRLPLDFVATVVRARDLACDVQIIICAEERHLANPFLIASLGKFGSPGRSVGVFLMRTPQRAVEPGRPAHRRCDAPAWAWLHRVHSPCYRCQIW